MAGTDNSDLRASFRHALSTSIPQQTLYSNHRLGGFSQWIFGVPLVDLTAKQGNVPKVMRMCIEEVEKRGLNTQSVAKLWISRPTTTLAYGNDHRKPHPRHAIQYLRISSLHYGLEICNGETFLSNIYFFCVQYLGTLLFHVHTQEILVAGPFKIRINTQMTRHKSR